MNLEEMILACGDKFTSLSKRGTSEKQPYAWCAEYHAFGEGGPVFVADLGVVMEAQGDITASYEERGHTPSEAVEKLLQAVTDKEK